MAIETADNEVVDRRAAIEAAFSAQEEAPSIAPTPAPAPVAEKAPAPDAEPAAPAPAEPPTTSAAPKDEAPEKVEDDNEPKFSVDRPPQSWRAPQKAKWAALDPEVRQEVIRREREVTKVLGDTAQARKVANEFHQVVQPFAARFQALNVNPIQAVQELLKADYVLTSAPRVQKAQYMAKLIKDYDIDFKALDEALAGVAPSDPVESKVEELLRQRLAPYESFIAQQRQLQELQQQTTVEQSKQTIEKMASDPKFPFFEDVREDMADLVEIAAKRGVYLSLEQAYTRAIAMNPEVSQQVQAQRENETKLAAAKEAHARAQRAKNASVSVGGAPTGATQAQPNASDRRATIEAAFEAVGGR